MQGQEEDVTSASLLSAAVTQSQGPSMGVARAFSKLLPDRPCWAHRIEHTQSVENVSLHRNSLGLGLFKVPSRPWFLV